MNDHNVINGHQLVERYFPPHGPFSPGLLTASGPEFEELLRYFDNVTRSDIAQRTLTQVDGGFQLLENLLAAADLQTKLYRRLEVWAQRLSTDPTLRDINYLHDDDALSHASALENADVAVAIFASVVIQLEVISDMLRHAHSAVSPLCHDLADDQDPTK